MPSHQQSSSYSTRFMTRIDFDPAEIGHGLFYFFLNSVIVPRPIAWVSSHSADGVDNLAPHSFFTISSIDPPVVQFTSLGRKDSLRNVEQTREFVVCFAPASLIASDQCDRDGFPAGCQRVRRGGPGARGEPASRSASRCCLSCGA
jgi:hypothetical protein